MLAILVVLGLMLIPATSTPVVRSEKTAMLAKMRMLHMATEQMTIDNKAAGKSTLWTCDGGVPLSRNAFTEHLSESYLQPRDLHDLLASRSTIDSKPQALINDAYHIHALDESDSGDTVFLISKNWHGPKDSRLSGEPFGDQAFVVFRKDGSGAVLEAGYTTDQNMIGTGGRFNFQPLK